MFESIYYTYFFIRNHFIRNLHAEDRNIYKTYTTKNEIRKELFNLKNVYTASIKD